MTNSLSSFGAMWQPAVCGLAEMGVRVDSVRTRFVAGRKRAKSAVH
jgi:hypothetical protein